MFALILFNMFLLVLYCYTVITRKNRKTTLQQYFCVLDVVTKPTVQLVTY